MFTDNNLYIQQLIDIVESDNTHISNIKPSEWVEANVIMEEPFPGLYKYSLTPYCREIIDCFAIDHPMLWIAIMKGAQIGISSGVLIPILLWSIANDPCRIYFMVGSPDLVEKATEKLDKGIDGAGLRNHIRAQVQRKRSQKSGDTNYKKEFGGGFVQIDHPNNHSNIRDVSLRKGLFDDFESVKNSSKQSGSTRKMLEQRFAAYEGRHKIAYVSTPEVKSTSNIEPAYLLGDQRKYLVPCPCCGEFIEWKWSIVVGEITGGIYWELDDKGKPKPESIGYKCQKCGDVFNDKNKHELLNQGYWQPTAEPSKPGYYSYHISALYAPLGMFDWAHYVNDWLEANPSGQPRHESLYKTFVNVVLGETYEPAAESPKATIIMKNKRNYEIGIVPNKLSIKDGNGRIVLVTFACDLNGVIDDARIDWEVVGWSESGASYSVSHGSIGTFIPREGANKADRLHWTYEHNKQNSVWPELDKIMRYAWNDEAGLFYKANMPCIDMGHQSDLIEPYLDWTIGRYPGNPAVGVRGHKEDKYKREGDNMSLFKVGLKRNDVYYLEVGLLKDILSNNMKLKWKEGDGQQPPDFMNFPFSSNGLYEYSNFFEHYESEHRGLVEDGKGGSLYRWIKNNSTVQNHMFDVRVYNMAIREIIVKKLGKDLKEKEFTWADYVNYITS